MEQYLIPAGAAIIVAIVEALAARDRKRTKAEKEAEAEQAAVEKKKAEQKAEAEKKHRDEQEAAREKLMVMLIQSTSASIALGEATARAVQRIPDAHCNGDMHDALKYATEVKHAQKDLLAEMGVHLLY